jgi:flagellar basal body P-ring formation protein FlgA
MRRTALLLAAFVLICGPALAGQPVALRAATTDADGIVTLSDLFENTGAAGSVMLSARAADFLTLDAAAVQSAARRAGLDWANSEGLRRIVVRGGPAAPSGAARGNVDVLTYARSLAVGEVIQPEDLVWAKSAVAAPGALNDPDALVGMTARRPLRAGAQVGRNDAATTPVIAKDEVITLIYQDGGITLTLQGRAMARAGVGETLNVQNTGSKKIVQAVVTGPGQAVVGPAAERLKLAGAPRYAAR